MSRYTNTTKHRCLWRVTIADAKKICSDERTSGSTYMLVWKVNEINNPELYIWIEDSGKHADVLADLGVTLLPHAPLVLVA